MPGTRRTPIGRTPIPHVSPEAVTLFERGAKLMRRKPTEDIERALSPVSFELGRVLGLKAWNDCPLVDCDCREPPPFLDTRDEIEDWWRSRWIREQLQDALRERRKAEREARKPAGQAPAPTPPPAS
jgi:hypothetical protein